MMSPVDYTTSSSVWTQTDKWKGRMDIRWIFVKDIPNSQLRHIRVWNNENKPVTNSRDTQELPPEAGLAMLRIFFEYPFKTSIILSNLVAAELKEGSAVEDKRQSNLRSVDELGQDNPRQSLRSEEYTRPSEMYPRQSWQSGGDDVTRSARQSYQFDVQDYYSRDIRNSSSLSRRNTISTPGPVGSMNRLSSSTSPTSGMRLHETTYLPAPTRFHETSAPLSTYRTMLSGFATLGDAYASNRYPSFPDRANGGTVRNDDDVRYF
jgi:hypothetical protein